MLLRRHHKKKSRKKMKPEHKLKIDYHALTVRELKELAKNKGIEGYSTMVKSELIKAIEGE